MANFDREQLRKILTSARIDTSEKNIKELDVRLKSHQIGYWAEKKTIDAGPSKELLGLHGALKKWLELCFGVVRRNRNEDDPNPYVDELLLVIDKDGKLIRVSLKSGVMEIGLVSPDEVDDEIYKKFEAIIWLLRATKEAADLLEAERPHTRRSGAETHLFRRLHEDYCELSGRQTLSERGPPIRFVKECAELIVPGVVVPEGLRQRLEYAPKQK
jgi:hypothetical protein